MTIQKIKSGRVTSIDADQFIGPPGTLFFNEDQGDLRLGDGLTPGGIPLSFGGGGGGSYTLPTASTTVKGGVKIDGSTITIANQVISVGTVPYSNLSGAPTIPTNTNQLTNGAGYITSSALSSYALTSAIPTNNNQLTNGAGYITSSALTGYATEAYVTGRGYITSSALTGLATESFVTSQGYLTSVSWDQLTNKPDLAGTYSFSIAGDDSTIREVVSGNTIQFKGAGTVSVTTSAEGVVTITGTGGTGGASVTESATAPIAPNAGDLWWDTTDGNLYIYYDSSWVPAVATTVGATGPQGPAGPAGADSTVPGPQGIQGEKGDKGDKGDPGTAASLSWNDLTDKPNLAGTYSWSIAADDSTLREISTGESVKFIGAGGITTSSDAQGNITITGIPVDLTGYATESFVTTQGYITGLSWDQLTDKPNLAGTYSFNIAGTDSTLHQISSDNTIQFKGTGNIDVTTNADGVITINIPSASVVTDTTPPTSPTNGELWWDTNSGNLYIYYDSTWVISNDYANITDYYQLTSLPDLSVYALRSEISTAESFAFSVAADDSTLREITNKESIKFIGAGGITTSSDVEGNITITGAAQDRLTSNTRSAVLNSNGTFSLPTLTATPSSPQAGQMALADGVSWNPLSQSGGNPYMVIYTGTSWLGLGGVNMDQVYAAILELGTAGI